MVTQLFFLNPELWETQLARLEEPFVEPQTKTEIDQTERADNGPPAPPEYERPTISEP